MEGTILYPVQINMQIITVVEGIVEQETRSGHCPKTYADTVARNVKLAIKQIVRQVRQFVEWWSKSS